MYEIPFWLFLKLYDFQGHKKRQNNLKGFLRYGKLTRDSFGR